MPNLNEKITDYFEMEKRVCSALAPYVTRYREGDFPFINGKRVAFEAFSSFPWQLLQSNDYSLGRMSDIAKDFYRCILIPKKKERFLFIDTVAAIRTLTHAQAYDVEPLPVSIWADVVKAVADKLIHQPGSSPAANISVRPFDETAVSKP